MTDTRTRDGAGTAETSPPGREAAPRARFTDLLAAEWIKLRTLRSTWWGLLVSGLVVLAFNIGTAWDTYRYWRPGSDAAGYIADGIPLYHAFTTNGATVLALCAGAFGALAVTGEYTSGLARTTFTAVPARRPVMAAKVLVLTAVTVPFGAVLAAVSFWATQAVLHRRGVGVPLDHPGALRLVVASALLAPVCVLVGAALGALLRHGPGAVFASIGLLQLLPLVLTDDRYWPALLDHATVLSAWVRFSETVYDPADFAQPWSVGGAWTVFAVTAVVAGLVTVAVEHRRDL
ncbi:ABC transporter permease [Streptomyces avicenniae]|uniref:ABC transporter permease n=1 Tax=Streptomyces avicenniae TaxID=500153 RepID=UPI00069CA72B|nr:ABC transporter permease [Streptomyces avicenniae]